MGKVQLLLLLFNYFAAALACHHGTHFEKPRSSRRLIQSLHTHISLASSDSLSSVSGASDRHRGLWRGFPSHGGLCGRDESLVWIRGPGLCHVYRRPVGVDVVSLVGFSPSLLLVTVSYSSFHWIRFVRVSVGVVSSPLPGSFCAFCSAGMKLSSRNKKLWLISVSHVYGAPCLI